MFKHNLTLGELFKPNSLRNMTTTGNDPMPHTGPTYYIWHDRYCDDKTLETILGEGNKRGVNFSINSYIDLSDKAHELISSRFIQYGPNSSSSNYIVRIVEFSEEPNRVRITANGWGNNVIELYDLDKETFIQYLKDFQKR